MTPEGKVKEQVKRILKSFNDYYGHIWYYMPVTSGFGKKGIPDFIASIGGFFVAIETKAAGQRPTALQSKTLAQITHDGGISLVLDETNIDNLEHVIDAIFNDNRDGILCLSWRP